MSQVILGIILLLCLNLTFHVLTFGEPHQYQVKLSMCKTLIANHG